MHRSLRRLFVYGASSISLSWLAACGANSSDTQGATSAGQAGLAGNSVHGGAGGVGSSGAANGGAAVGGTNSGANSGSAGRSFGGNAGAGGSSAPGAAGGQAGSGGHASSDGGAPSVEVTDSGTWALSWSDEFDVDGAPASANWDYERGFVRNEELQWYQPENATVSNGILTIAAQKVHVLNPNYVAGSTDWKQNRQYYEYTSTAMITSGRRSWQYGRFEIRARIDIRQGSWPAFWILGEGAGWPQSGEVDIMEYYADKVLANVCTPSGGGCDWDTVVQSPESLGAGWPDQFHVWAMEWDAQHITLFLDEKVVNTYDVSTANGTDPNPYANRKFYILINLALGGSNGGDPANTTFPMKYEVDYVRVYQKLN